MAVDDKTLKWVGAGFGIVGLIMLSVGGFLAWKQVTILKAWPQADATVAESNVTNYVSEGTVMYTAEISFRYNVAGREYVSPAPSDFSSSNRREITRKAEAHPVGSRHRIKYNPEDPEDIRFGAGYTLGFFFLPLIFVGLGSILAGIPLTIAIVLLRSRRRAAISVPC